jgi:hypothetical protein
MLVSRRVIFNPFLETIFSAGRGFAPKAGLEAASSTEQISPVG